MFLQTLQYAAITRLHGEAEPFHVFDASTLESFSFLPTYQPLPDNLLAWRIESLETLDRAILPFLLRQGVGAILLNCSLALYFHDFPGAPIVRNR